ELEADVDHVGSQRFELVGSLPQRVRSHVDFILQSGRLGLSGVGLGYSRVPVDTRLSKRLRGGSQLVLRTAQLVGRRRELRLGSLDLVKRLVDAHLQLVTKLH